MEFTKIRNSILRFVANRGYKVSRCTVNDQNSYLKYFSEDSIKNKRFYNIGAGGFNHPFWTNIDNISEWYVANTDNTKKGIPYDLLSLSPIPINSNSAEIVYTSHTIEHITDKATQFVFGEVYRILKNNGVFRITTPNIEMAYRAFQENDLQYFQQFITPQSKIIDGVEVINYERKPSIEQSFLIHHATCLSTVNKFGNKKFTDNEIQKKFSEEDLETALNYFTSFCTLKIQKKYPGNHINWWNKEKIFDMLNKAGFTKVFLSGYSQSVSPVLRNTYYFDNTYPQNSIYVEAIK